MLFAMASPPTFSAHLSSYPHIYMTDVTFRSPILALQIRSALVSLREMVDSAVEVSVGIVPHLQGRRRAHHRRLQRRHRHSAARATPCPPEVVRSHHVYFVVLAGKNQGRDRLQRLPPAATAAAAAATAAGETPPKRGRPRSLAPAQGRLCAWSLEARTA